VHLGDVAWCLAQRDGTHSLPRAMGVLGYCTPNIDRIGKEGAVFTDWYGQQSCRGDAARFRVIDSEATGSNAQGIPDFYTSRAPQLPTSACGASISSSWMASTSVS